MTEMLDVMNFILNRHVNGLPVSALSEVFDRLIWCLDDNGSALEQVRRQWLSSNTRKEVEAALFMSATFPYDNLSELEICFERISYKWPDLEVRCNEVLNNWKNQFLDD